MTAVVLFLPQCHITSRTLGATELDQQSHSSPAAACPPSDWDVERTFSMLEIKDLLSSRLYGSALLYVGLQQLKSTALDAML